MSEPEGPSQPSEKVPPAEEGTKTTPKVEPTKKKKDHTKGFRTRGRLGRRAKRA